MQYRVSPDVLAARLAAETVLLDMRTKNYFQLNATGARVWDSLERGDTMEVTIARLGDEYDVPSEQVELEARALLAALLDRQLLIEEE